MNEGSTFHDESLDLRGIPCPGNAAKALLRLEGMEEGGLLELWVDEGEPMANVPLAIEDDGHEILQKERIDARWWRLLVRKT